MEIFASKRRYGIGDRKERIQNLRKNYSFKVEFDLHSKAQALGVKVPRLVAYTEVVVQNTVGRKVSDLSTEFILMEALPGRTLLDFKPAEVKDKEALERAFEGLRHDLDIMHQNNLYHGDLSLKNMMIVEIETKGGRVEYNLYIIDFGRAYEAETDMFADGNVPFAQSDDALYNFARHKYLP